MTPKTSTHIWQLSRGKISWVFGQRSLLRFQWALSSWTSHRMVQLICTIFFRACVCSSHRTRKQICLEIPLMLLAMFCEHSNWQQSVPLLHATFASTAFCVNRALPGETAWSVRSWTWVRVSQRAAVSTCWSGRGTSTNRWTSVQTRDPSSLRCWNTHPGFKSNQVNHQQGRLSASSKPS